MSYEKHRGILANAPGDNMLYDGHFSIKYADVPRILKEIDAIFCCYDKDDIRCLGLSVENKVIQTIVVLYLLSEKINFYLLPGDPSGRQVPPFCDRILSFLPDHSQTENLGRLIQICMNPDFVEAGTTIEPLSGAVFFSSSGTSGLPKYVYFQQENLIRNARNCLERFRYNSGSRVLIPVPINHMYGMGAGWLPAMISGACICLIDRNNIVKLYDKIAQFSPDITLITPAVCKMLLMLNKDISAKTIYITAGEIMKQEVSKQFESRYGTLINLYGCTEQGAIATTSLEDDDRAYSSAGLLKPLDHVAVEIDGEDKGEILCKHNAGFEGYVDKYGNMQPGLEGKSTWYRTKDIGWHNGGSYFKVIGRKDNCINRSGFLISLEEIEYKLEDLFPVKKAVVFECDSEEGLMNRLVAICELADGMDLEDRAVKDICRNKMSRHQMPDEFYFVRHLPRLNNGKPDRFYLAHNYKTFIKN